MHGPILSGVPRSGKDTLGASAERSNRRRHRVPHLKRKHGVTDAANTAHACVSSLARPALVHHVRDQGLTSLQHADRREICAQGR